MTKISLKEIKHLTGVGFGTSGIRDKNELLTDKTVYIYTKSFLNHLQKLNEFTKNKYVALAGDLRPSTVKILTAVTKTIEDYGLTVVNCGYIPTPAVSYFGFQNKIPSIMVTGSHIPADRNGIKYQLSNREVLKSDEEIISNAKVDIDETEFNDDGSLVDKSIILPKVDDRARQLYIKRYVDFFDNNLLKNKNIGVYGHSAVGRDIMVELFEQLGANVTKIEFMENEFLSVDTDAVDEELVAKMNDWTNKYKLNYIISTDGDGDRPLLSDENGNLIRSELLPMLASKYIDADAVATTLTACTIIEKGGYFNKVVRTKVGSPYVIEAMLNLVKEGYKTVTGYELNGGFLLQSDVTKNNKILLKLPTRDSIFPILATISLAVESKNTVSQMIANLPKRYSYASSIKGVDTQKSLDVIASWEIHRKQIEEKFGTIVDINLIDGLRLTFENENIVHFRPSKNSPEFRDYAESDTYENAKKLSDEAIDLIRSWVD